MISCRSILFVRLPCQPLYPVGLTYLATHLQKHFPDLRQQIIDLSLLPKHKRLPYLKEMVKTFRPDILAFSWRDIQIFAPHEGDSSLETAFNFFYSPNPFKRAASAIKGLALMGRYYSNIRENHSIIRDAHRQWGKSIKIVIGGSALSAFYEQLLCDLPEGVLGIIGEGEELLRKIVGGESLEDCRVPVRNKNELVAYQQFSPIDISDLRVDFDFLAGIFPQISSYKDRAIGVQTKRGCHFKCAFCIYPFIEGNTIRYRKPEYIVDEVMEHARRSGMNRFWFTDAQFIPGPSAVHHCSEVLERLTATGLGLRWSSYIRTSLITPELSRLMVASGLEDLEVSITSGDQGVLNNLRMGFKLEDLIRGCRYLKESGFKGKIILNYSLNSPGETAETLQKCVNSYRQIVSIFQEGQVFPFVFFIGIQPHSELERRLIREGHLSADYNPLSLSPLTARKMLYNPPPLDKVIGRACLKAWAHPSDNPGRDILLNLEHGLAAKRI